MGLRGHSRRNDKRPSEFEFVTWGRSVDFLRLVAARHLGLEAESEFYLRRPVASLSACRPTCSIVAMVIAPGDVIGQAIAHTARDSCGLFRAAT